MTGSINKIVDEMKTLVKHFEHKAELDAMGGGSGSYYIRQAEALDYVINRICHGEWNSEYQHILENEEKKNDPEYQTYLKLHEKFKDVE